MDKSPQFFHVNVLIYTIKTQTVFHLRWACKPKHFQSQLESICIQDVRPRRHVNLCLLAHISWADTGQPMWQQLRLIYLRVPHFRAVSRTCEPLLAAAAAIVVVHKALRSAVQTSHRGNTQTEEIHASLINKQQDFKAVGLSRSRPH